MGSCDLEESLLPTFAWQHYSHLIPDASPPMSLRLWINYAHSIALIDKSGSHFAAFGRHLLANQEHYGHIFGLKAPRHEFSDMALAITTFLPSYRADKKPALNWYDHVEMDLDVIQYPSTYPLPASLGILP